MPNVSRRAFFELATGMIVSLPTLAGGLVLAPTPAYAEDSTDEDEQAGKKSEYVIIDVVEPWEVGVMVVDITKGVETDGGLMSYPPVPGAKVTVTSRFNNKVVSGTTGDTGVVNLDIRSLSVIEEGQNVNELDDYHFNGSVTVAKDGWRDFKTALIVVQGGSGLQVPIHPLDEDPDMPYPYLGSFDEWDALYLANDFLCTPSNTDTHTIATTFYNLPLQRDITFELIASKDGKERVVSKKGLSASELTTTNVCVASVSFSGQFLKADGPSCLAAGTKLSFRVHQGDTTWTYPLSVTFSDGIVDEPAGKQGQELCPINSLKGGATSVGASWPSGVPLVGNGDLKFWAPSLPIDIYVNPFGLVQLTLKSPSWGYRGDTDFPQDAKWGSFPRKSVEDQWARKKKVAQNMSDKTSALVSKPGAIQEIDFFKSITMTVNFQLLALAQWDPSKGLFQGEVAGQIFAALNFTISENFFAGPIPVLITFSLDSSLIVGLAAAAYSTKKDKDEDLVEAIFDLSRWQWDYQSTGFNITFNLTPSLSVGVGIRGLASISVKGAITLTLYFCVPMGTQPEGLPEAHFTAGWSARISLVLELFLFTQSFSLFNKSFSNFYDNWKGESLYTQEESVYQSLLENYSINDLLSDLAPITDAMLSQTSEASIAAPLFTQAEGEADYVNWDELAREKVVELDDGTTMTFTVYDLNAPRQEDAPEEIETQEDDQNRKGTAADDADEQTFVSEDGTADDALADEAERAEDSLTAAAEGYDTTLGVLATGDADDSPEEGALFVLEETEDAVDPQILEATTDIDAAEEQALEEAASQDQEAPTDPQAEEATMEPQAERADGLDEKLEEEPQAQTDALPAVTWLQAAASSYLPDPGIAALGAQGGVRPSSDERLFGSDDQHVLSAAHTKVLDIGAPIGKTKEHGVWCFRIASVTIGGQARTRIIANCIDGDPKGSSKIIEFDTKLEGMSHGDLYDYDFDLMVRKEIYGNNQERSSINFVILSGKRDNGGNMGLAAASTDLVITYLWLSSADFVGTADVLIASGEGRFSMRASELTNVEPDKLHSISNLKIGSSPSDLSQFDVAVILFLDRYADTAEGVLDGTAHVCVGALNIIRMESEGQTYLYTLEKYPADWWAKNIGDIDSTVYEADFCPGTYVANPLFGTPWYLMLRGANKAHYIRTVLSNYSPDGIYRLNRPIPLGDFDPSVRLVWSPGVDGFLSSYPNDPAQLDLPADERDYSQWTLHKLTWTPETSPSLQVEPIGPSGFNVVNFAVLGDFIFWPQSRDADEDRVWGSDGTEDVRERAALYQIMACRIRAGHFSDPFVVADLPTDTDMLAEISVNTTTIMEALRTVPVDTGERGSNGLPLYHAADIWYTAVPAVRCVTATACEAPTPFVEPGGKIGFHVAVRNDGNTFISGCTLELCAYNEESGNFERVPGASAQLTFGKDNIQESTYNISDGEGGLTGLEPDYALAPGKTSVYAVTVSVPKDWTSGDKKVLFVASDGKVASDYALSSQAEGEDLDANAVEFHLEPGEHRVVQVRTQAEQDVDQRHMDIITVNQDVAGGVHFQRVPVTKSTSGNDESKRRSKLPQTGDSSLASGGMGLAGAGMAALGAAVAAYERRRAENESQD
ncbi:MAG: hypothetical protein IJ092_13360 [Atopobiaceae bacterium]|nr:hypothetical protein [Atopobiaceae bacterium]